MNRHILLDCICIVLCQTSHPGNIGATARAIKTMGINDLRLVSPKKWPHPEAEARSAGALDILQKCQTYHSLSAAISDCMLVAGLTARSRDIGPLRMQAREAAAYLVDYAQQHLLSGNNLSEENQAGKIALVFGNEASGLSNNELQSCNLAIEIPSEQNFSSLNLGAAVQVMAYECRMAAFSASPPAIGFASENASPPATLSEIEYLINHWQETMIVSGFLNQQQPKRIIQKLKRMILRNNLQRDEVNLLRGFLSKVTKYSEKNES